MNRKSGWIALGLSALLVALLAACVGGGDPKPIAATMVMRGGTVLTMDAKRSTAQAVAIRGKTIVAVGSDDEISRYIGSNTQVIDLKGQAVLPGFIDGHIHPVNGAERLAQCSVDGVALSVAEIVAYVKESCLPTETNPAPDKWIQIANVNPADFVATAADLDQISATRPVVMHGIDGHTAWVNTVALGLAHIDANTPDPVGGQIDRDANGKPTGFLKDAAQGLVDSIIPPLSLTEKVALAKQALGARQGDYLAARCLDRRQRLGGV